MCNIIGLYGRGLDRLASADARLSHRGSDDQGIFIVDSYSRDATIRIVSNRGAHSVQRNFRGFGDQGNFAMEELPISSKWTMKSDSDGRLSDHLKASITRAVDYSEADILSIG